MISIISGILLPAVFYALFYLICNRKSKDNDENESKLSKDEKKKLKSEKRKKQKEFNNRLVIISTFEIALFTILNIVSIYAMNFSGKHISPVAFAVAGIIPFAAAAVKHLKGEGSLFSFMKRISIAALILIAAEVFLFNAKSFDKNNSRTDIPVNKIFLTEGAVFEDESIVLNSSATLTMNDVPKDTTALLLDFDRSINRDSRPINVTLTIQDENLSYNHEIVQKKMTMAAGYDTTLSFQPYGDIYSLKVSIDEIYSPITIEKVTALSAIPFSFSLIRFFVLLGVIILICAVVSFKLWKVTYQSRNPLHILLTELVVVLCTLSALMMINPYEEAIEYDKDVRTYSDPYNYTFDAFMKKQVSLDIEPEAALAEMDNVYDTSERNAKQTLGMWDFAYYKGKYYSYFGCTPVLTFNFPYYWINDELPTVGMTVSFFGILAIWFMCRAILAAVKLLVPKANLLILLSFLMITPGVSGIYYCINGGSMYTVPTICGLCWLFACLWLGIKACLTSNKPLKLICLFASGVSLALCAGSRPGIALSSAILIPLFIGILRNKEQKPVFRGAQAACFCVPLLIGGVLLMMYNNARFGSPFDFGFTYQLTVSDISANKLSLAGLPPMLYHYIFQMPRSSMYFPFFEPTYCVLFNYQKYTYLADCIGVFTYPVIVAGVIMIPTALRKNKCMNNCNATMIQQRSIIILCFAIALFTGWSNFCLGGAITRYIVDLMPLLLIGTLVCILRSMGDPEKHRMRYGVVLASIAISFITSWLFTIQVREGSLLKCMPNIYDIVEDLVIFWQ